MSVVFSVAGVSCCVPDVILENAKKQVRYHFDLDSAVYTSMFGLLGWIRIWW